MKRLFALCLSVLLFTLSVGCAPSDAQVTITDVSDYPKIYGDGTSFDAVVLEVYENSLLVECTACPDNVMAVGSQVTFAPSRAILRDSLTSFYVGMKIRVLYDGSVMESYPLQLGEVYGVYQLDGNGTVCFYKEPTHESEIPEYREAVPMQEADAERLREIIDGVEEWTDDRLVDRLAYYFDGVFYFANENRVYFFCSEYNVIYFDQCFAEIPEEDMEYILGLSAQQ